MVFQHFLNGMSSRCFLIAFLILAIFNIAVEAKTRCFNVKGQVICHGNNTRHADVEIYLMDDDGPGNPDDTMGWTTSNEDGTFKIEGCGYDFLSDPDPYLRIYNTCNDDGTLIKTRLNLPYMFSPEIIDTHEIRMDS